MTDVSLIDMMRGEHIRSKVYAICLVVFKKKLAICSFRFKYLKTKVHYAHALKGRKREISCK